MNDAEKIVKVGEPLLYRMLEVFPPWALLAPVAFAFAVVFLILFFRQQETLTGLLKTLFIPPIVVTVLSAAWAIWLLVFGGLVVAMAVTRAFEIDTGLLTLGLVPLVLYPALLGLLAIGVICIKHPTAFIPLVIVGLISSVYLIVAYTMLPANAAMPGFGWWLVLVPVLIVALVYVVMMYVQDARSVHPLWATFLGFLRCCVYGILALIFLMPGCQYYDTKPTKSKVIVLFDISGSMHRVDELPKAGEDQDKMPNRLDHVIEAVFKSNVLDEIQKLSPVTVYRFGARLDDYDFKELNEGDTLTKEQWKEFLFPDLSKVVAPDKYKGKELEADEKDKLQLKLNNLYDGFTAGTNVSGSALQALLKDVGTNVQSIIIFSDGQSNLSSGDSMQELLTRTSNPKKPTHIITVCVGKYIEPKSIRIEDIQSPEQARPDDKFIVQVPVYGDGLDGRNFEVALEAEQVVKVGDKWEPKAGGTRVVLTDKGTFKNQGGKQAFDKVKFEIDVRKLCGIQSKDDTKDEKVMGFWQFTAKVPRDPDEHFAKGEHVSRPAQTLVQKKKMRVLLFSGGPSREYQFLRTLLFREVQENRMELSLYLQSGKDDNVDQDVPTERLLSQFPITLPEKHGDPVPTDAKKYYDLSSYDVIVAIDPDWTELSNKQLLNVKRWVTDNWAGGFVFVAGPINTFWLGRDEKSVGKNLNPIKELLPVVLKDSRLAGFGIGLDPTRPYMLNLKPAAAQFDFMRLSETGKTPKESWNEFFWEGEKPAGKPVNGFFSYYPVEKLSKTGTVLATFDLPAGNPLVPTIGPKEPPFIAETKIGKGQSVYLGSAEFWRLRQVDEEFYKRFWVQLIRYVGSGTLNQINENGIILAAQQSPVGIVSVEAALMEKSKAPFPPDTPFELKVQMLEGPTKDKKLDIKPAPLKPRPDAVWTGWFQGEVVILQPGRYRLSIAIPGTNKEVDRIITVFRPDPEKDNPRPNPDHLYELASTAAPVLKQIDKKLVEGVQTALLKNKRVSEEKKQQLISEGKDELRLCFDLPETGSIAECLVKVPPSEESMKAGSKYLLDIGTDTDWSLRGDQVIMVMAGGIGGIILLILLATRRWLFAGIVAALVALTIGAVLLINLTGPNWEMFPMQFSYVLAAVAVLLCLEWLTRKLLRLA